MQNPSILPPAGVAYEPPRRGPAHWWAVLFGLVLAAIGAVLAGGGAYLIYLGGSWYYLLAGLGLIAAGVLMMQQERTAVLVYGLVWLGTLVWAFWEVGLDGWALVPRIVAPSVLLALVIVTMPFLRRPGVRRAATVALALALGATAAPHSAVMAQATDAQPPAAEAPDAASPNAQPSEPDSPAATAPTTEMPAREAGSSEATPGADAADGSAVNTPDTPAAPPEQALEAGADWPAYGGTNAALRYSPLTAITTSNVADLREVWSYRSGDMPSGGEEGKYSPENTPLKIGDTMYACTGMGIVIALDPATGAEKWRHDPGVSKDAIPYGATCRGVAYYQVPGAADDQACATRIIWGTLDARLIAVDAKSGALCEDFGAGGSVDLNQGIGFTVPGWYALSAPPTIVRGVAVVGAQVKDGQAENAPSGVIRGYDATTGAFRWAWDMGAPDRVGEPQGEDTYTRGTPNMWTVAAADPELGYVYLPLGNSAVDYYGGNRKDFENDYSSSLVALDATTGKPVWHFQTVHYDVWDYDLGSQVTLIDLPTDTGKVPALILPSKQGQIYVLNRETGESLFPVEERDVPRVGVEAAALSPTQPYSGYAHLDKPELTERAMWGMSPIDQLWCRIQFRRAVYEGEYTAPTADSPYIEYPGYNGGSDWGSVAVDPERGILIANYNDMANYNRLIPREQADAEGMKPIYEGGNPENLGEAGPQVGSPYAISINAGWRVPGTGMLCTQPPYGWIRGIDLATGKTLWDHALGSAVNNGPFGIPSMLPVTIGTPNNGGPLVTAGGLTFVAATTDDKFRAFDTATGEMLWQTDLPAGGQTTPITYEVDGRQYVAIAPGGHHFMQTKVGDYVIAFALPTN